MCAVCSGCSRGQCGRAQQTKWLLAYEGSVDCCVHKLFPPKDPTEEKVNAVVNLKSCLWGGASVEYLGRAQSSQSGPMLFLFCFFIFDQFDQTKSESLFFQCFHLTWCDI